MRFPCMFVVLVVASNLLAGGPAPGETTLFCVLPETAMIRAIDPATGEVLNEFPTPDAVTPTMILQGLTIAEGGDVLLYVNDEIDPTALYRLDPSSGAILSVESMTDTGSLGALSYQSGATDFIFHPGSPSATVNRQEGYGGAQVPHVSLPLPPFAGGGLGGDDLGRHFAMRTAPAQPCSAVLYEFDPTPGGGIINTLELDECFVFGFAVAFDGSFVYVSEGDTGGIFVLDPDTGATVDQFALPGFPNISGLAALGGVPCASVQDLACNSEEDTQQVDLQWSTGGQEYTGHDVLRDGMMVGSVGGSETSFVDPMVPDGTYTYTVSSRCADGSLHEATCEVTVVVNLPEFIRSDADGDLVLNTILDALFVLSFGFVTGSPEPPCMESADADADGVFNAILDGLYVLNAGFVPGSPLPTEPYPDCGVDPDPAGSLGCLTPTCP